MVAGLRAGHRYAGAVLTTSDSVTDHLEMADWRRRVAELYAQLRADPTPGPERLAAFRVARDELFRTHPQSPVAAEKRSAFRGLAYWPHDPALRMSAALEPDPAFAAADLPASVGDAPAFTRLGWVEALVAGGAARLAVYWLAGYAGGIFIPFRDATSGHETYAGGRYLWDSAKGADLGSRDGRLVLDFNYAFHPSCVYDPRWSCPLAPAENWLAMPVRAGERLP